MSKIKSVKLETELDFEKVCRTCLSDENQLINIFEIAFEGVNVPDIFNKYMKMEVEEYDDLPQNICYTCLYELCHIYMFINNSKKAQDKLRMLINAGDAKEVDIIDNEGNDEDESVINYEIKEERQESEEETNDYEYNTTAEEEEVENNDEESETNEYYKKEDLNEMEENIEEYEEDVNQKEDSVDLFKLGPIRVPEVGPPFTCYCGDEYGTLEELKEHRSERKHTNNIKRYLCRICSPSRLYSYKSWFNHMKSHTNDEVYQCELCGRISKSVHNHYRHLRSHNGEKPFICEICGKSFSRSTGLNQHRLNHERENDELEKNNCRKTRVVQSCDKCDIVFSGTIAYNKHMFDVHGVCPYNCQICGKSFALKASLKTHLLVHSGKKEFKCHICDKSFVQKTHLITHYKVHTGEKPFECPYCGKRFAMNGNLTVHKRKHTGEKPYVCNICERGFYDSSSMKAHMRKHF